MNVKCLVLILIFKRDMLSFKKQIPRLHVVELEVRDLFIIYMFAVTLNP